MENIGEHLYIFGLGKEFLDMTQKVLTIKENVDKLDFIKFKTFIL